MTPEELKTAWRTVLVPMELTDVEEALSYLVPAQRKPSRWMGLREEKFAKEFMEDVEDGTGNKMPKDLVLVLVDHWVERKRTKGQEDSSTMPVLAAAVVDAALASMARKDTSEQTERALRRAMKNADKEGPDMEANSPFGKALLELNPTSSKLGEVARTGKYNGMGHVQGELAVEAQTAFWQQPRHRVSRQAFRMYLRKLMQVCKTYERRFLAERIAEVLTFLDSIPSWNVAYVYLDLYMNETNGTFAHERLDKCYLDAWMQVYGTMLGGPPPASSAPPSGAAETKAKPPEAAAAAAGGLGGLAKGEMDVLTKLAKQPVGSGEGYDSLSGPWLAYSRISVHDRINAPTPEAAPLDALTLFDAPPKTGPRPTGGATAEGGSSGTGSEGRKCYNCKGFGHLARDCPDLSKEERAAKHQAAAAANAAREGAEDLLGAKAASIAAARRAGLEKANAARAAKAAEKAAGAKSQSSGTVAPVRATAVETTAPAGALANIPEVVKE
jgi:hypothetical protein